MSLNSIQFLLFFGAVLIVFWILCCVLDKRKTVRYHIIRRYLLLCSCLFVAVVDWKCLLCVGVIVVVTYVMPILYNKNLLGLSKGWIHIGIAIDLLFLGIFKYFDFFVSSVATVLHYKSAALNLILPIGISFYTFSSISYMVDIERKKQDVEKSFIDVALYILFFPKFLSGPIVRAESFFCQLTNVGTNLWKNFETGIQIFVIGCFKKMVIADHLGVFVDDVFHAPVAYHWMTVLWATVSYSLQIYFDFAGYSDMAIGVAKILGFEFEWNFNFPYISGNLTEFWKRWHISLSSWLQEYLYYPLGGNRKGRVRSYMNLLCTMLLGGLWHGAAWTFVIWGALHGVGLIVHKIFMQWKQKQFGDKFYTARLWTAISVGLTFAYVNFCWIWFRAEDTSNAIQVISQICGMHQGIRQPYTWTFFAMILLVLYTIIMYKKTQLSKQPLHTLEDRYIIMDLTTVKGLTIFFALCGLTMGMAYVGNTAFIYGAF